MRERNQKTKIVVGIKRNISKWYIIRSFRSSKLFVTSSKKSKKARGDKMNNNTATIIIIKYSPLWATASKIQEIIKL